jgi:pimeloyl-ACP methyl ester carboxylesterase
MSPTAAAAIVLVHGWQPDIDDCADFANPSGKPRSDPGEVIFRKLVASLTATLPTGARVYAFTYPTFEPFADAGDDLAHHLSALVADGVNSIVVVAHSMGGLVSRYATSMLVAKYAQPDLVRAVLTLGSPHSGFTVPFQALAQYFTSPNPGAVSLFGGLAAMPGEARVVAFAGDLVGDGSVLSCSSASLPLLQKLRYEAICHGPYLAIVPNDGLVPVSSALATSLTNVVRLPYFFGYDHSEIYQGHNNSGLGASPRDIVHLAILTEIQSALQLTTPQAVGYTDLAPVSLQVVGTTKVQIGAAMGYSGRVTMLTQFDFATGTGTVLLPLFSPGLGLAATELQVSGGFAYWRVGGIGTGTPYSIRRIDLKGTRPYEVIADGFLGGTHYELSGSEVFFKAMDSSGTWWIRRVPRGGGASSGVVMLNASAGTPLEKGFTVHSGEIFYEDCLAGTVRAHRLSDGVDRLVSSGLIRQSSSYCFDELLVVGSRLYIVQVFGTHTLIQRVHLGGGTLTPHAEIVEPLIDVITDGRSIFGRDLSTGRILRVRLSNFLPSVLAPRSCGGLSQDRTYVYWGAELAPSPAIPCVDGGSVPFVRAPK